MYVDVYLGPYSFNPINGVSRTTISLTMPVLNSCFGWEYLLVRGGFSLRLPNWPGEDKARNTSVCELENVAWKKGNIGALPRFLVISTYLFKFSSNNYTGFIPLFFAHFYFFWIVLIAILCPVFVKSRVLGLWWWTLQWGGGSRVRLRFPGLGWLVKSLSVLLQGVGEDQNHGPPRLKNFLRAMDQHEHLDWWFCFGIITLRLNLTKWLSNDPFFGPCFRKQVSRLQPTNIFDGVYDCEGCTFLRKDEVNRFFWKFTVVSGWTMQPE